MTRSKEVIRTRRMVLADISQVVAIADSLPVAPHWKSQIYQDMLDPTRTPPRKTWS